MFVRPGTDKEQSLLCVLFLGLISTTSVLVGGALAGAAEASASSPVWNVPTVPVELSFPILPALTLFYGGMVLLARSWLGLRRYHLTYGLPVKVFVGVVAVWSIPLLLGPPLGSRDVYAYAAQGKTAEMGFDVYEVGPSVLGVDHPVLGPVDPLYYDAPVVYGPAFVGLSEGISYLSGDGVIASVLLFRLVATVSLLVAGAAVFSIANRLQTDAVDALILGLANPLVLVHLVSGAHNEAFMLAFLVGGIAVGMRSRFRLLGIALCALAAAIKLPAILGAAFLVAPWVLSSKSWLLGCLRAVSGAAVVVTVFALAGRLTGLGWGWIGAISSSEPVDAYLSLTTIFGFLVSTLTGLELSSVLFATRALGYVAAASVTLLLLLRQKLLWIEALAWSLFVAAVFHPTTQPWYLTWSVLLLAAVYAGRHNRHLTAVCVVAAFTVLPSGPRLGYVLLDGASYGLIALAMFIVVLLTLSPKLQRARRFGGPVIDLTSAQREHDLDRGLVSVVVSGHNKPSQLLEFATELGALAQAHRWELIVVTDDAPLDDISSHRVFAHESLHLTNVGSEFSNVTIRTLQREAPQRWGGAAGALSDGLLMACGARAVVISGSVCGRALTALELVGGLDGGSGLCVASRWGTSRSHPSRWSHAFRIGVSRRDSSLRGRRWWRGGWWWGGGRRSRAPWTASVSSYGNGGSVQLKSVLARMTCRILFPGVTAKLQDPLSGCFAVSLDRLDIAELHPDGPRLLIEVAATHPDLQVSQVDYHDVDSLGSNAVPWGSGAQLFGHLLELRLRTSWLWSTSPVSQRAFPEVDVEQRQVLVLKR